MEWTPSGQLPARHVCTMREPSTSSTCRPLIVVEQIDTEATRTDHDSGWAGCLESLAAFFGPPRAN
jgi:hypothetical protein